MDNHDIPIKSLRFRWQQDLSGMILFDIKNKRSFRLNSVAFELWNSCDGVVDVAQIVGGIALRYQDVYPNMIRTELTNALIQLHNNKMIIVAEKAL